MAAGDSRAALLIIDQDSLVHNGEFISRLGGPFALSLLVRQRRAARMQSRRELVRRELWLLLRLVTSPWLLRRRSVFICSSGHYAALCAARIGSLLGRDTHVFLYNLYLHELGGKRFVRAVLRRLLTERVTIAAQTERDAALFSALGPNARVALVAFGQDPITGVDPVPVRESRFVFSGGYTNRDYDVLLRCARSLPAVDFVVAASSLNTIRERVPANVRLLHDAPGEEFNRLLAHARLVVLPLKDAGGAAGQMVCLAAMSLARPIIVPDLETVTVYVEGGVTGIVYPVGDETALRDAIATHVDDGELLTRMGDAALVRYRTAFVRRVLDDGLIELLRT